LKEILWRVYENVGDHRVLAISAGVTFYVLLALFPALAALISLYGLFADPAIIGQHIKDLAALLPGGALQIISEQTNRLTSQSSGQLGFGFLLGLAISFWSANAGMKALFDALNVVYGEHERRSFIRLNAISLTFTVCALALLLLAIAGTVILPLALNYLGLATVAEWMVSLGRWPVLFIAIALAYAVICRYGPSRKTAQCRWVTWGSAFAALAWLIVSVLFSWYAAHFGSYNEIYGTLGAIVCFMTWIWVSMVVVLLGAELDAQTE
jgi:membrane protein